MNYYCVHFFFNEVIINVHLILFIYLFIFDLNIASCNLAVKQTKLMALIRDAIKQTEIF